MNCWKRTTWGQREVARPAVIKPDPNMTTDELLRLRKINTIAFDAYELIHHPQPTSHITAQPGCPHQLCNRVIGLDRTKSTFILQTAE